MDGPEDRERSGRAEQPDPRGADAGRLDYFLVSLPQKDLVMYSDAVKVVGADFEVADLTMLIKRALAAAVPASA